MYELVKIESIQLEKVVKESGLQIQEGEEIKQSYLPFLNELAETQSQASKINFENPAQIDETIARELRLKTVKIRTGAEGLKDSRKKIHLLKGNLEQAAYNLIAASCKLTEETFNSVEKAREIAEKKIKEILKAERIEMLLQYDVDGSFLQLGEMPIEVWESFLLGQKTSYEIKIQAEKQAELERLTKEKAEADERERIRVENVRLKSEAIESEKKAMEERKKQAAILAKQKSESEAKQKAIEEANRIEHEKQAAILKKEKEAKTKLENELKAELEKKAKELAKIAVENKAKELAEKKASLAPDKDKLKIWINQLTLSEISLSSLNASDLAEDIRMKFKGFKNWATYQINNL